MKRIIAILSLLAMIAPTLSFFITAESQQPTDESVTISAEVTQTPLLTAKPETTIEATETVPETTTVVVDEPETETTQEPETSAIEETSVVETSAPETTTVKTKKVSITAKSSKAAKKIEVSDTFEPFTSYLYNDVRCTLKLSKELQYHTYLMSEKYGVPYRIIMGLMGVETGWTADIGVVTSSRGAKYVGLGCLNEHYNAKTFADRGIDIYTPEGNIEAICWLIRDNLKAFDNNIDLALMAYNGGAGYAKGKIAQGITSTKYTQRVHYFADSLE